MRTGPHLVGLDRVVADKRAHHVAERQLDHHVVAILVATVKEPEAVGEDRGALDVELLDLAAQLLVERMQVDHLGLAVERAVGRQAPGEPAVAGALVV